MTKTFIGARDVEPSREVSTPYEFQMTGADQRVARDPETLAWLARALGEKKMKSRAWPIFDERRLEQFLEAAGIDTAAAVKAHEDTMPPPAELTQIGPCIEKLRGASFLNFPEQEACVFLKRVVQGSPHRR